MSTPLQETSGPRGLAGPHPAFGQPAILQEPSTSHRLGSLTTVEIPQSQHAEEQFGSLVKSLDGLRLGMDDGDGFNLIRGDALLTLALRMDDRLREISDQIGNWDFMRRSDKKDPSEHMDEIRAIVSSRRSHTYAPAVPGELPPPAPKVFFGRNELVGTIVDLTERFTSIALTGTGGVGKTSIVLTVLDDFRIKQRFGDNRSFIRCDQLNASHTNFLRKLSEVTGAGVENPEDLSPLRRYLSSKEMIMVLDNTESILGLPETSTQEIHAIVDELSRFSNICLVFTSRVSNTLPTHCEIIEIPTLSMEAGHETFYRIYRFGERSDPINEILRELDFHPLSITLFATVAQQNRWDTRQLTMEWESHRTRVLRTRNLGSLAATVELSLASSMFQELGPDARDVLEVVAFFPQGLKEVKDDNVDGPTVFDIFCNLSLTHRCNGFITMLAPLRDYLRPRDPMASPFLRTCKEFYFKRLSVDLGPGKPGFHESQWITSEDVNVEHLLDVFTSIDPDSDEVWYACYLFMDHLYWHKPRLVILRSKVEALPDSYLFKLNSLVLLSRLFDRVGNRAEQKRMLTHSLGIWREKGDDIGVVETLAHLSIANAAMGLYKEGIQRAREALEILGRLGETEGQVLCLIKLASFLRQDEQFDAAVEAASRAMVLSENGDQLHLCKCHDALTAIYQSTGNMKKVIYHYEASLRIASLISPRNPLLKGHFALARLYFEEGQLDEARGRLEFVKSRAGNSTLSLGRAFLLNAHILHRQRGFEEAKSDASCAADIFEKLGIMDYAEQTREVVGWIEKRRIEELGNDDMDIAE